MICPFNEIIRYIPEEGNLLDLGSGYGIFCAIINSSRPHLNIIGIEFEKKRVEVANQQYANKSVVFLQGDVITYKFECKFDIITCIDVFHHIPSQFHDAIISKLKNNLTPGGILIVKDMDKKPFIKFYINYIHDILITKSLRMNYFSKEQMIGLLENHALKIKSVAGISNILYAHYLIICSRNG
jgi:2-polyprenyl-3-methyl-5-hydroxy-6-metoxy-1,4-benzoquinol methylase